MDEPPSKQLVVEGTAVLTRRCGERRRFSDWRAPFFTVDTCVFRCYKPQKDKLFGGESPNELPSAVRE